MKTYREVPTVRQELDTVTCDRCKKVYDDIMEIQEFLNYENNAGYASVMGDGNILRMEMCQHCVKEVLGPFIRIDGNYMWGTSHEKHQRAFYAHELSQNTIQAIKDSKMDPKHDHLNSLLEDDNE